MAVGLGWSRGQKAKKTLSGVSESSWSSVAHNRKLVTPGVGDRPTFPSPRIRTPYSQVFSSISYVGGTYPLLYTTSKRSHRSEIFFLWAPLNHLQWSTLPGILPHRKSIPGVTWGETMTLGGIKLCHASPLPLLKYTALQSRGMRMTLPSDWGVGPGSWAGQGGWRRAPGGGTGQIRLSCTHMWVITNIFLSSTLRSYCFENSFSHLKMYHQPFSHVTECSFTTWFLTSI